MMEEFLEAVIGLTTCGCIEWIHESERLFTAEISGRKMRVERIDYYYEFSFKTPSKQKLTVRNTPESEALYEMLYTRWSGSVLTSGIDIYDDMQNIINTWCELPEEDRKFVNLRIKDAE